MKIHEIFDAVSSQMLTDLEKSRAATTHAGIKGTSLEISFRTFLRHYLPRSLDVCSGILVDSAGGASRQLDVIVCDAAKTPIFYSSEEIRVIPCECAYAVFEIKTHLDSVAVGDAYANMRSVKRLMKTAVLPQTGPVTHTSTMYDAEWHVWPTLYFLFGFEGAGSESVLSRHLELGYLDGKTAVSERIDTICVLNRYVIPNRDASGMVDALPSAASVPFICPTKRSLLLFYALLSRYLNQTRMPDFSFRPYLGQLDFPVDEKLK